MIDHTALAERFGTPLYVYDLDDVRAARRQLFDALPSEVEVYYALKANPHPGLVKALCSEEGGAGAGKVCRAEISSTGELANALAAGVPAADILYTGPGKTVEELRTALTQGVRTFSTDSVTDVRRVGEVATDLGVVAECLLRINSATASATTGIRMTGTPSQFGFDSEVLGEVLPALRAVKGVEIAGMHFFPLSNAQDEENLVGEFRHTIELAAHLRDQHGIPLRLLDIGGGFTVPYGQPGPRGGYPKLRGELAAALDTHFPRWRDGDPTIACESGRYLAGGSGVLVTRVANVKMSRGRGYVILDAGINTFGGMSGLGRLLPVSVAVTDGADGRASLVGPLCTPGDVLGRDVAVPDLGPDDLVVIPNTGAYGPTASLLMFLGRPAPAEVLIRGGDVVSVSRIEHERVYVFGDGPSARQ
ncbi:decarboxylase [Amycolatopsis sp. WAC 01375]|uniref:type III PLP-dependent enzyme n=1 Tax=unclassified Amycolatopsis TaxID=2618356 RepID=UPI000F77B631|nr:MULTISPECIES: type III PLP-dependent enzyme [unclassified Amycolatopsis]RSM82622.1 decarboxylase [Amycolatopsis sp. WAC 01375]RSN34620.1 decarboxylase [Amycolatopsis sp. WAC 01416]